MLVYVGGVPGSGKTSIIRATEKLAHIQGIKVCRTIGTDIMCELAGVSSVKELRQLPEEIRKSLRPEMNRRVYELDRNDPSTIRLCDGHYCFFDVEGKSYGKREIQPWDQDQLKAMILVFARPQTILTRRTLEQQIRPDRQITLQSIMRELQLEAKTAFEQTNTLLIPLKLLKNDSPHIIIRAYELLAFVRELN